jgi:hypothetical protein
MFRWRHEGVHRDVAPCGVVLRVPGVSGMWRGSGSWFIVPAVRRAQVQIGKSPASEVVFADPA